ncbi:septin [Yamadazyma tenuis]|uniref:Septin n=1 Tax=Candida tenuis (strain ATCC 10573 / BCRC 21748 / CBS 615 / JCM 9827 / NBRC 10315 / NRRL Y-1498 / VKM Y-70) TaxID=590646 RepID=G3BD04_CANTC|nr:Septin [Yamadazyma tenuis ATCC 10573]EGV60887.1 Septin [Yamadazyma tenuis ATCC 10573]WEJ93843.1 septin [Yamadazyma tenuis]
MDDSYNFESPSMVASSPMINYRKDARKGVKFSFMVVGESGTGKTTFVNSLLSQKVLAHRFEGDHASVVDSKTISFTSAKNVALPNTSILQRNDFNPSTANEEPGIALTETKVEIVDEANTKLQLTIVDTPGYGDNFNNEVCFAEIENYLKQQFDLMLAEETKIRRNPRFVDTRIHVMLYFITPNGHGLKELDISCMKRLSKYVNIIPVISKADSFTEDELKFFKKQVKVDIERFNVPIFQFDNLIDEYDEEEDYELIQECKYLAKIQPFAIIGSEDEFEVKDTKTGQTQTIKARQYPWGLVDISNPKYSDFSILKSVLLGSHLQDLKDLTHDFLYESYRTERLTRVTGRGGQDVDYDDTEFHDSTDHQVNLNTTIPSMSNLAQLSSAGASNGHILDLHSTTGSTINDDSSSITSSSSKKPKSMLLDDADPSVKSKDNASFTSSASTISLDQSRNNLNTTNPAFKRLSIAPQRNQLRQISETVPYVIRHERILERQQKLEEMEMASAKELASRAALLEKKAAELKARERAMKKIALEREQAHEASVVAQSTTNGVADETVEGDETITQNGQNGNISHSSIRKEETLTDLHSMVSKP